MSRILYYNKYRSPDYNAAMRRHLNNPGTYPDPDLYRPKHLAEKTYFIKKRLKELKHKHTQKDTMRRELKFKDQKRKVINFLRANDWKMDMDEFTAKAEFWTFNKVTSFIVILTCIL